jgi:hypothetical protein
MVVVDGDSPRGGPDLVALPDDRETVATPHLNWGLLIGLASSLLLWAGIALAMVRLA